MTGKFSNGSPFDSRYILGKTSLRSKSFALNSQFFITYRNVFPHKSTIDIIGGNALVFPFRRVSSHLFGSLYLKNNLNNFHSFLAPL
jgi:hypothetical protein